MESRDTHGEGGILHPSLSIPPLIKHSEGDRNLTGGIPNPLPSLRIEKIQAHHLPFSSWQCSHPHTYTWLSWSSSGKPTVSLLPRLTWSYSNKQIGVSLLPVSPSILPEVVPDEPAISPHQLAHDCSHKQAESPSATDLCNSPEGAPGELAVFPLSTHWCMPNSRIFHALCPSSSLWVSQQASPSPFTDARCITRGRWILGSCAKRNLNCPHTMAVIKWPVWTSSEWLPAVHVRPVQMGTSRRQCWATPKMERAGLKRNKSKCEPFRWSGPGPGVLPCGSSCLPSGWLLPGSECFWGGKFGSSWLLHPGTTVFQASNGALQQCPSDQDQCLLLLKKVSTVCKLGTWSKLTLKIYLASGWPQFAGLAICKRGPFLTWAKVQRDKELLASLSHLKDWFFKKQFWGYLPFCCLI